MRAAFVAAGLGALVAVSASAASHTDKKDKHQATEHTEKGAKQGVTKAQAEQFAKLEQTFTRAWNQGNIQALEPILATDVVQVNPFGVVATGEREVLALIEKDRKAIGDDNTRFTLNRVRQLTPTVAVLDYTHSYSKAMPEGQDHADLTMVATKRGNDWEIKDLRVTIPVSPPEQRGTGGAGTVDAPEAPAEMDEQAPEAQ